MSSMMQVIPAFHEFVAEFEAVIPVRGLTVIPVRGMTVRVILNRLDTREPFCTVLLDWPHGAVDLSF
jgi:hypothetical protein